LHKILTKLYNHKTKSMRWKPMYGWWGGWKKWAPMKIGCKLPRDDPFFCPSKCWAHGSMAFISHFDFFTKYSSIKRQINIRALHWIWIIILMFWYLGWYAWNNLYELWCRKHIAKIRIQNQERQKFLQVVGWSQGRDLLVFLENLT